MKSKTAMFVVFLLAAVVCLAQGRYEGQGARDGCARGCQVGADQSSLDRRVAAGRFSAAQGSGCRDVRGSIKTWRSVRGQDQDS